jgi:3-hydroxyisobutyrate dehydrogenase
MRSTCARVLAQEAAASAGANTPLGAAAAQLYAPFNAAGSAGDDLFGIIKILCDWA